MCATPVHQILEGTNQIIRVIISRRMLMAGALEVFNEHQHFRQTQVGIMDHTALITIDNPGANTWDTESLPALAALLMR